MRFRRTILAPAILMIGATGALAVGPVLTLATAATPAVAANASPDAVIMHG